jgi:hypothetical protein
MSKGERNRTRLGVRTTMEVMAAETGRYLGGRPPYGFRLVDAGPHPNPSKATLGSDSIGSNPIPSRRPSSAASSRSCTPYRCAKKWRRVRAKREGRLPKLATGEHNCEVVGLGLRIDRATDFWDP